MCESTHGPRQKEAVPSPQVRVAAMEEDHRLVATALPALASGAVQAVLFNPLDRALYVRIKYRRKKLLDLRNFDRPFQGFVNAAVYRTLVGASYMFFQDRMRVFVEERGPSFVQPNVSPSLNASCIGLCAGAINGLSLNMLQAVKFRMWNMESSNYTFSQTARLMYRESGLPIFFRGCATTMIRDSIFGVVYETCRRFPIWGQLYTQCAECVSQTSQANHQSSTSHNSRPLYQQSSSAAFFSNLVAAVIASMFSSPFNYVRSIVYGTPAGAIPLGYISLLRSFCTQVHYTYVHGRSYTENLSMPELCEAEYRAKQSTPPSAFAQSRQNSHNRTRRHPLAAWRWANSRLNIGWGSLRVGVGMAMGQCLFYFVQDYTKSYLKPPTSAHPSGRSV